MHNIHFFDVSAAFLFGRRYDHKKWVFNIFRPKTGRDRQILGQICQNFGILAGKNPKFSFFEKSYPNDAKIVFCPKMCLGDPKGQFLAIYIHVGPYLSFVGKVKFWRKSRFLRFFWIFHIGLFGCKKAQKMQKIIKKFKIAFFTSQRCL